MPNDGGRRSAPSRRRTRQPIGEIVAVWISALFAAVTLAFAFAVFRRRDVAGDLARHGVGDGTPGLLLVPVPVVAAPEVGERHGDRPVLHLPDMAELVADQVVARPFD